jgi:acetylornithine/N-succinyldiaminopimelate aminotransferase
MQGVMIAEPHTCGDIVARLRDDHQLLTVPAGQNVIRLLPPLIVSDAEIDQAVEAFRAVGAAMKH